MKKAVIFDMDGTIFDSEVLVIECWEIIADKYQIPEIKEPCMNSLGVNAQVAKANFKKKYGEDFPYDEYKKEMSELYHKKAEEGALRLKPGVIELLTYLNEKGYKAAVASSTREFVVRKELNMTGIISYFDEIIGGDKVEKSKPNPDIFLLAAEKLGVKPEECIVLEDSFNGIRAAHRAGMMPIMIPDLVPADDEMRSLSAHVMDSLLHVKEFLEREE